MDDLMTEPLLDSNVDALGIIDEVIEAFSLRDKPDEWMRAYLVGNLRELRGYVAGMLEFLEDERKDTAFGEKVEEISEDVRRGILDAYREVDLPAIQQRRAKRLLDSPAGASP